MKNTNPILVEQPITGPGDLGQSEDCWKPGMVVTMTAPANRLREALEQNKGQNSARKG